MSHRLLHRDDRPRSVSGGAARDAARNGRIDAVPNIRDHDAPAAKAALSNHFNRHSSSSAPALPSVQFAFVAPATASPLAPCRRLCLREFLVLAPTRLMGLARPDFRSEKSRRGAGRPSGRSGKRGARGLTRSTPREAVARFVRSLLDRPSVAQRETSVRVVCHSIACLPYA